MDVSVVGAGKVTQSLAGKWTQAGHRVFCGVRDVDSANAVALAATAPEVDIQTIAAAVASSDLVVFAISGTAMPEVVSQHRDALQGKTIIDATNQTTAPDMSAVPVFTDNQIDADIYRAFNSLGFEVFETPVIGDVQADHLYCGPKTGRRHEVERLIQDVGLRPIYVGELDHAPLLDASLRLWHSLAVGQGMGRHIAFKVLS